MTTAVREFGSPATIGPALRAELLRPHLQQLSTALLLVGAVVGLGWRTVLDHAPPMPWSVHTRPAILLALDTGAEYTGPAALGLAALGLLLLVTPTHLRALTGWRPHGQRWATYASIRSRSPHRGAGGHLSRRAGRARTSLADLAGGRVGRAAHAGDHTRRDTTAARDRLPGPRELTPPAPSGLARTPGPRQDGSRPAR
ncbi:hypothetical protein BKA01_001523 [Pseudonocardia eucalypti]|uniref:hypothetical protein n=1 Tax=Pseudonocardia eucalypti TaxID=648755 RepID=UPI00162053EC|nr:hypothetical protein [Pseudonocardia eucalypti]